MAVKNKNSSLNDVSIIKLTEKFPEHPQSNKKKINKTQNRPKKIENKEKNFPCLLKRHLSMIKIGISINTLRNITAGQI